MRHVRPRGLASSPAWRELPAEEVKLTVWLLLLLLGLAAAGGLSGLSL